MLVSRLVRTSLLVTSAVVLALSGCAEESDTPGPTGTDGTDVTDATDSTDQTDGSDATDATDTTDSSDATDATDSTDTGGDTDVMINGDVVDGDTVDGSDAADATDATDTTDATDATDAADGGDPGVPNAELLVKIFGTPNEASGADSITVSGGAIQLSGLALGEPTEITWKNETNGEEGTASGSPFWQTNEPIFLEPGANRVVVTARRDAESVTDWVVVTYNKGFLFDAAPKIFPDQLFVGEAEKLVVRAGISQFATLGSGDVKVWKSDADGQLEGASALQTLYDNGSLSNCDDIQADGVFSACLNNYKCTDGSKDEYFVVTADIEVAGEKTVARSAVVKVECGKRINIGDCDSAQLLLKKAKQLYIDTVAEKALATWPEPGSTDANTIRDSVLTWIRQQAEVESAGAASDGGAGIWVEFTDGFLGVVSFAPEGYRGGASLAADVVGRAAVAAEVTGQDQLRSKKALVLAPFNSEFSSNGGDEAESISSELSDAACPRYDVDGPLLTGAADLRMFRNQYLYGVIAITSHGDTFFQDLSGTAKARLAWDHKGGQEVLWTGEKASCSVLNGGGASCSKDDDCPGGGECVITSEGSGNCIDRTQMDLRKGRVLLSDDKWAVAAPFVSRHAQLKYPGSMVYLGGCRTLHNGTFAAEYMAAGALSVVGYSGYVHSAHAYAAGTSLFTSLVEGKAVTGAAFAAVEKQDPVAPHAKMRLFGATQLNITTADMLNAGFELGDLTGWDREGDGRVIRVLGETDPVAGKYMAIISTGLGFTDQVGEVNQSFCIPEDKKLITFYWKFYSEEFKEFCGSTFQDSFEATLEDADGTLGVLEMVSAQVDHLCHYEDGDCGSCPNPESGNCQCGSLYVGLFGADVSFDKGGVFTTSWQTYSTDISFFAGKGPVTVRFFATDVGDSIYDTAILVDDVKFD